MEKQPKSRLEIVEQTYEKYGFKMPQSFSQNLDMLNSLSEKRFQADLQQLAQQLGDAQLRSASPLTTYKDGDINIC